MCASTFNDGDQKLWIMAGEPSGDLYGALLARELQQLAPGLRLQGMGGSAMREAGVELLLDSSDLAIVGFWEVLRRYPLFRRVFRQLVAQAAELRPAVVVLIDYPGFNLRFARQLQRLEIPVVYYVSPQVWAWGRGRIPQLARLVRRMLVIFPFEVSVYEPAGLAATFVGHPLVGLLSEPDPPSRDPQLVVLLPGSRMTEVERLASPLLETAARFHTAHAGYRFVLPLPSRELVAEVQRIRATLVLPADLRLEIIAGDTIAWMRCATAGIAASGTVTVQAAIVGLPLVVVYRCHPVTYWLGRKLVSVPYLTMVNLVAEQLVFEEFLQGAVVPAELVPALERILPGGARRGEVEAGMSRAVELLGGTCNASRRAAEEVLSCLEDVGPGA